MTAPHLSIVIPVYNEEGIIHSSVIDLISRLDELGWSYEILLSENGSTDRTVAIAEELAQKHPQVQIHSLGEANYGKALKEGIGRARGEFVICDEIDLCDTDFYQRALVILEHDQADMVVGSKVMEGAEDRRPLMPRHAATLVINGMLRLLVGFHGTDTHGLKAFRRPRCSSDIGRPLPALARPVRLRVRWIRAERDIGKRRDRDSHPHRRDAAATSINLFKRVPKVLRDIARLTYIIRVQG